MFASQEELVRWLEETQLQVEELAQQLWKRMAQGLGLSGLPSPDSPYRVLGLDTSAPDEVVKLVYRHLARRLHPDAGGSAEAMARLNRAYEEIARQRGWK